MSLRTRFESDRHPDRSGGYAGGNTSGTSPATAVPSAGGVSSAAALLSLAVVLIPLIGWLFEHPAAGSPRYFFASVLERPG
jgi:hypothetical protein